MALETLKGVKKIGSQQIIVMDELREQHPERFTETGAMDHKWFEDEELSQLTNEGEGV